MIYTNSQNLIISTTEHPNAIIVEEPHRPEKVGVEAVISKRKRLTLKVLKLKNSIRRVQKADDWKEHIQEKIDEIYTNLVVLNKVTDSVNILNRKESIIFHSLYDLIKKIWVIVVIDYGRSYGLTLWS